MNQLERISSEILFLSKEIVDKQRRIKELQEEYQKILVNDDLKFSENHHQNKQFLQD